MTLLWSWSAVAPAAAVSGVCGDIGRAQRAASDWMRAHGADTGLLEEVQLAIGPSSVPAVQPVYAPGDHQPRYIIDARPVIYELPNSY